MIPIIDDNRPVLFAESNRSFWLVVRRLLAYLLHEIDRWYCDTL